jgi:hypothetical protein
VEVTLQHEGDNVVSLAVFTALGMQTSHQRFGRLSLEWASVSLDGPPTISSSNSSAVAFGIPLTGTRALTSQERYVSADWVGILSSFRSVALQISDTYAAFDLE